MNYLKKLIKSIILSLYWHKAMNAVYKDDFNQALKFLKISRFYVEHTLGNHLLKGWILFKLENFDESVKAMNIAVDKLLIAKGLNYDEKMYLKYYANIIINTSIDHLDIEYQKHALNRNFDVKNVSSWHKKNFPIPDIQ
jgi:hypothetical protein